jgi:hypothetical protein
VVLALRASDACGVGGRRRFARAIVLGCYEGSRDKAARKEMRRRRFFPAFTGWANLCRPTGLAPRVRDGLRRRFALAMCAG